MKRTFLWIALLAVAVAASGCSRRPINTREIYFYRTPEVNGGNPCAIDIIYPQDRSELDRVLTEFGPEKWFTSDLYDRLHKDTVWLRPDIRWQRKKLENKAKDDRYMVIFAEFTNPDHNPPRYRVPYLFYEKNMKKKARKKEVIWVHDGSLERLKKRKDAERRTRRR